MKIIFLAAGVHDSPDFFGASSVPVSPSVDIFFWLIIICIVLIFAAFVVAIGNTTD